MRMRRVIGAIACGLLFALLMPAVAGARDTIYETHKIAAPDGAQLDYFGISVCISGDLAIIGAMDDDDLGSLSGSAYIYHFSAGTWNYEAKLTASDGAAGDEFGRSVLIAGDLAVVGAWGDDDLGSNTGSAYVFHYNGSIWQEQQKLTGASDSQRFGVSVCASGDRLFVGAHMGLGSVYVFEEDNGVWSQTNRISEFFWGDVALGFAVSAVGNTLLTGAHWAGSSGGVAAIYEYDGNSQTWPRVAMLRASDVAAGDEFGYAVTLGPELAVIGSPADDDTGANSGSVYVFHKPMGGWSGDLNETFKLTASDGAATHALGGSVRLTGGGTRIVAGAYGADFVALNAGAAYIFGYDGAAWVEESKLLASDATTQADLGFCASVSGNTVLLGARNAMIGGEYVGAAYFFDLGGAPDPTGDLNCDGVLDAFDIDPFVLALTDPDGYTAAWPDCDIMNADCNEDGSIDAFDIDPFVELLTGG